VSGAVLLSVLFVEFAGGGIHELAREAFLSRDVVPMLAIHFAAFLSALPQAMAAFVVRRWAAVGWSAFGLALSFAVVPITLVGFLDLFRPVPLWEACSSGSMEQQACREHTAASFFFIQLVVVPGICAGLACLVVALPLMLRRPRLLADFIVASAAARRP
jgi:hypothetical protein